MPIVPLSRRVHESWEVSLAVIIAQGTEVMGGELGEAKPGVSGM